MPLTKVRYDMLADEVTTKITEQVSLSGAGSPLVFSQSGNTTTLTAFKLGGVDKTVRTTSISPSGTLTIELASFSPTNVAATGETLNWDQPATGFSITANNPSDFPDEYLNDIVWPITAVDGTVELQESGYTGGEGVLPLSQTGNIAVTFTLAANKYIYPTINGVSGGVGPATGGSASASVTFNKYTDGATNPNSNYSPADTWTTNWGSVSHGIQLAANSGNSFLQSYAGTTYTITRNALSSASSVSHTVTNAGTGVTLVGTSSGNGSFTGGSITYNVPVHKDNTGTARKVSLASVFTRPATVTGTQYTHTPTAVEATASYSFEYPSITLKTTQSEGLAGLTNAVIVDNANTSNKGFKSTVTRMASTKVYPVTQIVNSTSSDQYFWFGVSSTITQPTVFETGSGAGLIATATPAQKTVALAPTDAPNGYNPVNYNFYGFIVPANASLFVNIG
jgi:hypothetical protein